MRATHVIAVLLAAACAFTAFDSADAKSPRKAYARANCVKKAGKGWGWSKEMAQFQSLEIIQQVTGNWPIQTDYISNPVYKCNGGNGSWTCIARATVCKKS